MCAGYAATVAVLMFEAWMRLAPPPDGMGWSPTCPALFLLEAGNRRTPDGACSWWAAGDSPRPNDMNSCHERHSFEPSSVRPAAAEFTPRRSQRFQEWFATKEVIAEIRKSDPPTARLPNCAPTPSRRQRDGRGLILSRVRMEWRERERAMTAAQHATAEAWLQPSVASLLRPTRVLSPQVVEAAVRKTRLGQVGLTLCSA